MLREALVAFFREHGHAIACATGDPEELLARVRASTPPPQLAVVDLYLGSEREDDEPRGLSVLEELHRWVPETRAMVLSGTYDERLVQRSYEVGARAYVDKNTSSLSSILPALDRVLAGERVFPVSGMLSAPIQRENPLLGTLTSREREVLGAVSTGADNLKIAGQLGISERTVRAHLSALYRKLNAENRTELALTARKLGVSPPRG